MWIEIENFFSVKTKIEIYEKQKKKLVAIKNKGCKIVFEYCQKYFALCNIHSRIYGDTFLFGLFVFYSIKTLSSSFFIIFSSHSLDKERHCNWGEATKKSSFFLFLFLSLSLSLSLSLFFLLTSLGAVLSIHVSVFYVKTNKKNNKKNENVLCVENILSQEEEFTEGAT